MWVYSEEELHSRLSKLPGRARAGFATACAQLMLPLYAVYESQAHGSDEGSRKINDALEECWNACSGGGVAAEALMTDMAGLMPDDQAEWIWECGLAENCVAAALYALRAWANDDNAQEGVWAANQVYEAVDYVAQQYAVGAQPHTYVDIYSPGPHDPYRSLVGRLNDVLVKIETNQDDWQTVKDMTSGDAWTAILPPRA